MSTRLRSLLQNPIFLLCLIAGLASLVVQSGELGTSDTMHRLQVTHSLWTSEPQVFPNEYPEFGLHGRGGRLYAWYGIGQSLLMLPLDIVGTYVERLPIFDDYRGNDPSVRNIIVSYGTNTLICVLTSVVSFWFLRRLQFTVNQAIAGVLVLLFCTTHLHYTQNMMENNYIMLLTLTGLAFQYEWLCSRNRRTLLVGSAALGLNLLTRLTTALDIFGVALFLLLVSWFSGVRGRELLHRTVSYLKVAAPVYAIFFLADRAYQFCRFGSWFNTYVTVFAQEHKKLYPSLPPSYPFGTPFHVGFLGALFAPEKSIFLFDPLLVLTLMIAALLWKRLGSEMKAYVIAFSLLLLAYISFYARYTFWSGDFAWGDRYVSTAAQFLAFVSVPLLMRHRRVAGRMLWAAGVVLVVASAAVQVASLMFWCPLEIYQMETLGHPTFVIALRFKNVVAFLLGKMTSWGLTNDAMTYDAWDYVHITTFNFLPFLLKRTGQTAGWVVDLAFALWGFALVALLAALAWLWKLSVRGDFDRPSVPSTAPASAVHAAT